MVLTRAERRQRQQVEESDDVRSQIALLVEQMGQLNTRITELQEENRTLGEEAQAARAPSVASSVRSGGCQTSSGTNGHSSKRSRYREEFYRDPESVGLGVTRPEPVVQPMSYDLKCLVKRQTLERGVKLPQFSGDPREWATFMEHYKRLSLGCQYTDEENLSRLQTCLTGEAKNAVYALLAHPKNVPKILEVLRKRFGRPALVVRAIQADLIDHPVIKENDFKSLISFSSDVQNYISTLETLGCDDFKLDLSLLEALLNKLPVNLRVQWGEHVALNDLFPERVSDFSLWFESRAEAFSVIATGSQLWQSQDTSERKNIAGSTEKKRERAATKTCTFCALEGHGISECSKWSKESVEKRWDWAQDKRFCFRCLKGRHQSFRCVAPEDCRHCRGRHHSTLHRGAETPVSKSAQLHQEQEVSESGKGYCEGQEHHAHGLKYDNVEKWKAVLKTLPVRLHGPNGTVNTYALLDDASAITMVEKEIAVRLGLKGKKKPLSLAWTGDITRLEADSEQVDLEISRCQNDAKRYKLRGTRTVDQLGLIPQNLDIEETAKRWPFVRKGAVKSLVDAKPTIIIGQDNWPLLLSRQAYYGPWNGPIVSLTWLGWVLHGKLPQNLTNEVQVSHFHFSHWEDVKEEWQENDDIAFQDLVKKHLALDEVGATPAQEISQEEEKALAIFDATTRRMEGEPERWETGLLWKDFETLPESKRMALRRLYSLEKKLDQDPELGARYCAKMQENFEKGYARVLSTEEARVGTQKTWYLPHLGVTNPNKPSKLRVCFDASAKSNGYCFNDFLYKGPDLYKSIPGLLLNFRWWSVAMTADVKEMFPQIKIKKEDQDAQRFLWRGMDRTKPPMVCAMTSMIFGSVCSPFAAQEIRSRNAREFVDIYPAAAKAISERHYMDDYVESVRTEAEAVKLVQDVIKVHRKGGFEICGWASNSQNTTAVMRIVPGHLRGNCDSSFRCGNTKILGLMWDTENDNFVMKDLYSRWISRCELAKPPTRRQVLTGVMSIYDPLGFFTYVTIRGRILAQDIFKEKGKWDDQVAGMRELEWRKWVASLEALGDVKVPRLCSPLISDEAVIQLHIFCDAGARAYTAVAYLRVELRGQVDVCLIYSRARVAPSAEKSIPRLELQGAVMAALMGEFLNKHVELRIQNTFFWTDSRVVLHWLRAPGKKYPTFVANRIKSVLGKGKAMQWRWVPTGDNTADLATKEKSSQSVDQWWEGPRFLKKDSSEWPIEIDLGEPTLLLLQFEEVSFFGHMLIDAKTQELPDVNRFGSYLKLVRTTAWIWRLKWNAKQTKRKCELLPSEIEAAQLLWCRKVQEDVFKAEISVLRGKGVLTKKSRLYHLSPVWNEQHQLICVQGRIGKAGELQKFMNSPIVLDSVHPFTRLLVTFYHESARHTGQEMVLNELRQRFWILQARKAVRRAWQKCTQCCARKGKPFQVAMGELPRERLEHHIHPFSNVGVDYFGPFSVTVGRRHEKRYGALFTCMSTRAIHLEVVHDLSTDGMLMALRRFSARRGWPKKIFSDNGTNFHGAANELERSLAEWDQDRLTTNLANQRVEWHFNPPLAPHMGGCWERLIRSVKVTMDAIMKGQHPKDEVLATMFAEAESLVNSRPLTHVSLDPKDEEALTPNHFLIGRSSVAPVVPLIPKELCLRRAWRVAQQFADKFWQRWVQEYRPTLLRKAKWIGATGEVRVGDIVVVADPNGRRGDWPKGIVEAVYPGRDKRTRVADVKTSGGTFRRCVAKLVPLMLKAEEQDEH